MADPLDQALAFQRDVAGRTQQQPASGYTGADDGTSKQRKTLDELINMFEDFRRTTEDQRKQNMIDDDYYHGKQLTSEEVRVLNGRGQPDIVINRTRVAVNGILGVVARSHTDPKAWPRNPTDEDSASVATDCLRYATQKVKFNRTRVDVFKDFLIPGTAAVLVGVDQNKNVKLTQIRWEEFFYDPRARRMDLLDARYMGVAKWMYVDDVMAMYPEQAQDLEFTSPGSLTGISGVGGLGESFADRPINQAWLDWRNKRVMVVELYYRYHSTWSRCVFYYGGKLEETDSPYLDEHKVPTNPIKAVSCYVDRDNNRYGVVRDMRDPQDEVNKRRSKLLHLINSSQIQARDPSAVEIDPEVARKEAARPDGVIPYGWEKVQTSDMAQGQMLLLTEAKSEMERLGPNPAILGRQGADTSGRALLARQQSGLIELAILLDQMEDWELRIYEAIWERCRQYWTAPMFVRVTDDPNSFRFVQINEPQPGMVPGMGHNGGPAIDDAGSPIMVPGVLGYKNQIAEMGVDIMVDTTPATATIMQEQLQDLMQLISSSPTYAQQVPFEILLGLMQIPRKRELIKKIVEYRNQGQQQQAEQQQQQMELAVKTALAKIGHIGSQTELNQAKAQKLGADTTATALAAHRDSAVQLHEIITEQEKPPTATTGDG